MGCFAFLFALLWLDSKAQDNQKLTYYKINQLNVESFKSWSESYDTAYDTDKGVMLPFMCIPAKIVGIDKEKDLKTIESLNSYFKSVELIELKDEEALKLCSITRSSL